MVLKADSFRYFGSSGLGQALKGFLISRTFRVIVTMRLCQWACSSNWLVKLALPILQILHRFSCHLAAMDLPWKTEVAAGFAITHGWGLVVSPGAKIGKNVTLFHGVTLGRRDRILENGVRSTEYPILEDEVWVGPNAIVVGGVTIGKGSRIAGGAYVSESVPPYSVVSGNPAVVVKENCLPDVVNRANF